MISSILKYKKSIAMLLIISIIVTMIPTLLNIGVKNNTNDANERKIAAEVSTSTGVDVESILSLRTIGYSWNQVLDKLKGKGSNLEDRDSMNMNLTQEFLEDVDIKELHKEGYSNEVIEQATLIAQRVQFQLQEITLMGISQSTSVTEGIQPLGNTVSHKEISSTDYEVVYEKFEVNTAIVLMIKLFDSFGSMEKVMDEYLYSLQLDIKLQEYMNDMDSYQDKKDESSVQLVNKKVITMSDIENKMLSSIQGNHTSSDISEDISIGTEDFYNNKNTIEGVPKSPLPEIVNVTPRNPIDSVLEELEGINPLK